MNTQPQLQQESEKNREAEKIAFKIAVVAFTLALLASVSFCTYVGNRKSQPQPAKREIMPFQRHYNPVDTFLYDTGATGSLPRNPRTGRKGILINN